MHFPLDQGATHTGINPQTRYHSRSGLRLLRTCLPSACQDPRRSIRHWHRNTVLLQETPQSEYIGRVHTCTVSLTIVLLSQADRRFFVLLKKAFTWTEVSLAGDDHDIIRSCTHVSWLVKVLDDPARSIYSRDAISLLRLVKR